MRLLAGAERESASGRCPPLWPALTPAIRRRRTSRAVALIPAHVPGAQEPAGGDPDLERHRGLDAQSHGRTLGPREADSRPRRSPRSRVDRTRRHRGWGCTAEQVERPDLVEVAAIIIGGRGIITSAKIPSAKTTPRARRRTATHSYRTRPTIKAASGKTPASDNRRREAVDMGSPVSSAAHIASCHATAADESNDHE